MKKNMGSPDRIARVIVAVIIVALYFTNIITSDTLGIALLVLGGVFLLTSFVSFCPLYLPFGISTCKMKDAE